MKKLKESKNNKEKRLEGSLLEIEIKKMVIKKQDKDISDAAVKMDSMQKKYDVEKEIKKKIFESLKCENYKFEEKSKALQESTTILEKRLQDSLKETKNLKI